MLGFGTWKLQGDICEQAVSDALELGFTHFDTADSYANHKRVGDALKKSGIKRETLFLTTKIWYEKLTEIEVFESFKRFQEELQTDYIDLLLVHWPNKNVPIAETLKAMDQLKRGGSVKSIGVSNFNVTHLEEALNTGYEVSLNQVEFHPSLNQNDLKIYCDNKDIKVTAYSPNGQGQDLSIPEIKSLAKKYSCYESQIILAWLRQKGIIAIPKSTKKEHIKANLESLKIKISQAEIEEINSLNTNKRLVEFKFSEF